MKLAGKIAIVTGGSRGIGKATAIILADHGAQVVITSKNKITLENSTKEIKNVLAIAGYIRKESDVINVVKNTVEKFGRIDILINNAGVFP
jgi:dihydroanticapsin dehydrogenase